MARKFEITNTETNEKTVVRSMAKVAEIVELDVEDVEFALEDEGTCATDTHIVVEL